MSDLLDLAVDGHGGRDLWRNLVTITATLNATGSLFTAKGQPAGLGTVTATAMVNAPRLAFRPFAGEAEGFFAPDGVTVITSDGDERRMDNPRAACAAVPLDAPWDDLHLLYFTGYAIWNYLCTPFLLTWPGFVCEEIEPWTEEGQTWRRLRVNFPPDVPTHNSEQIFYFDDAGRLMRLDYAPDILGSRPAAHYCHDHRDFSGLIVPTRRRVYGRRPDGTPETGRTFVDLDISTVTLE